MPIKTTVDTLRLQRDFAWGAAELAAHAFTNRGLARIAPKAKQPRAVMTLPGFMGPEWSMTPLNKFLNRLGYQAEGWGQGANLGPKGDDAFAYLLQMGQTLGDRIKRMTDESGDKVALIGQSLGGVYAKELAFLMPDHIDRVISLGSPLRLHPDTAHHTNSLIGLGMKATTGRKVDDIAAEQWLWNRESDIPPVPMISIYSPYDGIVGQDSAAIHGEEMRLQSGAVRENIEVICSHAGMAVNPLCLLAVADRLAVEHHEWRPFRPTGYVPKPLQAAIRAWYPKALGYAHVPRLVQKPTVVAAE